MPVAHAALPAGATSPPQPSYVFRGHGSAIHSLLFFRNNSRLFSGDADGWAVVWSLTTKRPVAVWQAHQGTILGASMWAMNKLITHGRDGKICVWSFIEDEERDFSRILPIEHAPNPRKQPWLLHVLNVATLNFCAFACCIRQDDRSQSISIVAPSSKNFDDGESKTEPQPSSSSAESLLLAVTGSEDSQIDIFELPSQKLVAIIPAPSPARGKTGMVMAIAIFYTTRNNLLVIAGYESGRTYVFKRVPEVNAWEELYTSCPHAQPILSIGVTPTKDAYFTSSADAIFAKHPIVPNSAPLKQIQTHHAGQQGLRIRSDGKLVSTSGWDGRIRVYSANTLKELAVLKWHKDGCYATAFAEILDTIPFEIGKDASNLAAMTKTHELNPQQTVAQLRSSKNEATHWLTAGSKDGKISLWNIY